ncbi:MAG: RelA/SpoT family protein [Candidatus Portnoybacteria bacterium]|nr:RelA/SpoT family protein [Candidatus Portnoybacteria bacterium]
MPQKAEFLEKIKQINPNSNQDLIGRAFDYAQRIYEGRVRLSGQTLFEHCVEIALALAEINLGSPVIVAGLLHEALERVNIPKENLEKEFGQEITFMVEGVTNVGKVEHSGAERTIENLRKLFLATAKDTRVVLIKLVNRLHSLQTIYVFEKEKQRRLAKETLEIYAPIAYRLGMRKISGELEDLAFPIIYPEKHEWLLSQVKDRYHAREKYLQKLSPIISKTLNNAGIFPIEIHSRAKRYYSLYKKLMRYEMDLNKIYDLVALRIIVRNIDDCYGALGVIHKLWRPMPGRIKDYIALPKPNGYQSLHTTVFCPGGKITEFQIRTLEMHKEAEYGIAAHWFYSEQKGLRAYIKKIFAKPPEKELEWIKQLREWQESISSGSSEFLQALKIDFFKSRIFVFTPKGDVIDLPEGATPIDFAYHVHTSIGHRCAGAKVDGKMVSLIQPLKNGQVVEIITQKEEKPSQDWIRLVATNQAKNKIKEWFRKKRPQEIIETIKQKVFLLKKPALKPSPPQKPLVEIQGETKFLTNLAKCCNPQPVDQIIGYITINRGVSVHKADCPNLKRIKKTERLIPVSWKMT